MELREIPLEDVFPSEENPRQNFDGIEDLAESFEGGQPYNPIFVAQEGEVYALIDGERRYRAMRHLGTERCMALVAEDADDAAKLVAMVATDNKQRLTPLEMSRGIQQALHFAEVERVEKATGRKGLKRVAKAMRRVDDAAEDMSIDRLLAIEELGFSRRAVEELTKCKESEWQRVYDRIKRNLEKERREAELADALDGAGVRIMGSVPAKVYAYLCRAGMAQVPSLCETHGAGNLVAITPSTGIATSIYIKQDEAAQSEERRKADELRRRIDEVEAVQAECKERRGRWLAQMLAEADTKEGAKRLAASKAAAIYQDAFLAQHARQLAMFDEQCGGYASKCTNETSIAIGWVHAEWDADASARTLIEGEIAGCWEVRPGNAKELFAAYLADGYKPADEREAELFALVAACKTDEDEEE